MRICNVRHYVVYMQRPYQCFVLRLMYNKCVIIKFETKNMLQLSGAKNTKTAHTDGSCEWTEGESNPKSELARTLSIPIGLGPRIHGMIVSIEIQKQKSPCVWALLESRTIPFTASLPVQILYHIEYLYVKRTCGKTKKRGWSRISGKGNIIYKQ